MRTHVAKWKELYGGDIFLPIHENRVTNLSSYVLSKPEFTLLNNGLNFAIPKKPSALKMKIEMEKLYYQISLDNQRNRISINNPEDLKTKLTHLAIIPVNQRPQGNLTNAEQMALKELRNNNSIVIQRPDNGGGVVVMDRTDYETKLSALISNPERFIACLPNQTSKTKTAINNIAKLYKTAHPEVYKSLLITGDFMEGHLYGLPKLHKNDRDPSLRPIISMSGTVTHKLAQYLNSIIRQYLNKDHMICSSDELLVHLSTRQLHPNQTLCSLDAESLFTNVPHRRNHRCHNPVQLQPPELSTTLDPARAPQSSAQNLHNPNTFQFQRANLICK